MANVGESELCQDCGGMPCYLDELVRETDLGGLMRELKPDFGCWRSWVKRVGGDPEGVLQQLAIPGRNFQPERARVIEALLHALEPPSRAVGCSPYMELLRGYAFLFGRDQWGNGYFLVGSGYRREDVLTAEGWEHLQREAADAGLRSPYQVFARGSQIQDAKLALIRLGPREVRELLRKVGAQN